MRQKFLPIAAEFRKGEHQIVVALSDEKREQQSFRELQLDEGAEINIGCYQWLKLQPVNKKSAEEQVKPLEVIRKYRLDPALEEFESENIRQFLTDFLTGKTF